MPLQRQLEGYAADMQFDWAFQNVNIRCDHQLSPKAGPNGFGSLASTAMPWSVAR